jgi:hypothetical protein
MRNSVTPGLRRFLVIDQQANDKQTNEISKYLQTDEITDCDSAQPIRSGRGEGVVCFGPWAPG